MLPVVPAWPYELRLWTGADLAWLLDAAQEPDIARWTNIPRPFGATEALAFLRRGADGWATGTYLQLAITLADTGLLLGNAVVKDIEWAAGEGEVGYWLARDARGRGVATTAVDGLVGWCFDQLGYRRVLLRATAHNAPSRAVAERCGFRLVAIEPGRGYDGEADAESAPGDNALYERVRPTS
jgi:RimJ/RimL family protein N-acetyltransferase